MGSPLGSSDDVQVTGQAVQRMFAAVAPRYDFLNHLLSLGFDVSWRRAVARELREVLSRPGSVVADICCGTGDLTFALARYSSGTVIGADFCHPMLQQATKKLGPWLERPVSVRSVSTISFLEADSLRLPFPPASLDLIVSAFGFRNLADYNLGLQEMIRVLKPGAVAAILEFSRVRWPVFGPLFRLYLAHLLPRIGDWVSGVKGPYRYLHHSVTQFPEQQSLAAMMTSAGLTKVHYRDFMGGVAALHMGTKG